MSLKGGAPDGCSLLMLFLASRLGSRLLPVWLALNVSTHAQLANSPPVPHWLSAEPAEAEVVLGTDFEQSGTLLKAILLVASATDTEVRVNGAVVGRVRTADTEPAASLDLTRFLRTGRNRLEFVARMPRLAALLELNGDLARKQWLATDASWAARPGRVIVQGPVEASANPFDLKRTFDAYNSWQLAKREHQQQATDPADFVVPEGFKVELVRSAGSDEDSWIALAFDPQGRITLAREKRGLLRFDPASGSMTVIDDTLKECRGLLYAHGALYAHANQSRGLFRLRDADGDGAFEDVKEIVHTEGGFGHGRNHLKLGPDGHLWLACGNNVLLPSPLAPASPLQHSAWDQVLPNPWDGSMFDGTVEMPAGYILRVSPEGDDLRVHAGGLRNPLDLAFNREGELFTFDADMERDVGASWYMPNRVLHLVSGADFGWRRGTGRLSAWQADTLPSVVDIGLASPTAVFFGYGARFPARYEEALFICDWSYGRILAVHVEERGASYRGRFETFVSGRPLNVTDGAIGPDGALWFLTGGRGTQSGLYRVTWQGEPPAVPTAERKPSKAADLRQQRRELEALHGGLERGREAAALAQIRPGLEHSDRHLRWAARLALEQVPVSLWKTELVAKATGWRALMGCLALARVGEAADQAAVQERLRTLPWRNLMDDQRLAALRALGVSIARHGDPEPEARARLLAWLEPLYPAGTRELNQELCRLLVRLGSTQVVAKSLPLLRAAQAGEDLLFYPLHLRYVREGWTLAQRRLLFEALNRAEKLNGASTYFKAIQDTRSELAAALPPDQAESLAALIHPPKPVALSPHALPGHTFREWKLEDLEKRLDEVGRGRSFASGRDAAIRGQCVFCHRVSNDPTLPGGIYGPELVQVSARFGRRDLLDHILNPSKVIDDKYRFLTVTRADGGTVTGALESEDDERLVLRPNPLAPDTVEIGLSSIRKREEAVASPMPAGLLNSLRAEQILDLLAFLEAGGDPAKANFQP
jgi:putative heme-binding domain-containing protein